MRFSIFFIDKVLVLFVIISIFFREVVFFFSFGFLVLDIMFSFLFIDV